MSVIVPCFDDERFLTDCLESVARQTFEDWECIVVDDASRDRSASIALGFVRRDPRFRVVTHARNGGLSAARNTGLRAARGPLVALLDSDDMLLPNSLAHRVAAMAGQWAHDDVAGVYCGVVQAGEHITVDDLPEEQPQIATEDRDFLSTRGECPFNVHAPLVRTDLMRAIGGFDESLLHGAEDWDLWLRLMRHGLGFVASGETGAVYRQRRGSMVKRMPTEHLETSSTPARLGACNRSRPTPFACHRCTSSIAPSGTISATSTSRVECCSSSGSPRSTAPRTMSMR